MDFQGSNRLETGPDRRHSPARDDSTATGSPVISGQPPHAYGRERASPGLPCYDCHARRENRRKLAGKSL